MTSFGGRWSCRNSLGRTNTHRRVARIATPWSPLADRFTTAIANATARPVHKPRHHGDVRITVTSIMLY